jgi:hypothetical protein
VCLPFIMTGLSVRAIHVLGAKEDVDARDKSPGMTNSETAPAFDHLIPVLVEQLLGVLKGIGLFFATWLLVESSVIVPHFI